MIATGPGWELRLGDCIAGMRALPDSSVDHTIADPPYSAHVDANFATMGKRTGQRRNGKAVQQLVTRESIGIGVMTRESIGIGVAEIVRVTRRWIGLYCAFEQIGEYRDALLSAGGRYVRACAWEKPDSTPQLSGDRPATWGEAFVLGYASTSGAMRWNGGGKRGLYRAGVCRGHERSDHPTQKPLSLMREILEDFTDRGDVVMDPFTGSGSTGVACKQLGRRFLGFELDRNYFDIACRRLRGEEAKPNPAQPSLF